MTSGLARVAPAALLLAGCAGLDVANPNAPDRRSALSDGNEVRALAVSTVNSWYMASTNIYPSLMTMVTADGNTSNFCMGTRFSNLEPRDPYLNSSQAGADQEVASEPWRLNYATLGSANDVLRALDAGVQIDNGAANDKYRAIAMFSQAASLTNLALLFDSAFVLDETADPETAPPLRRYYHVAEAALGKWDGLIAFLNGRSDVYSSPVVLPLTTFEMNSQNLGRMANTMAALTLRLNARTPAELAEQPTSFWTRLLNYANAGITADVTVQGDFTNWYSYVAFYGNASSWMRVDYRRINRMDALGTGSNPVHFRYRGTSDIRAPGNPTTNDQRLGDGGAGRDYQYLGAVLGDPARGVFMQSAYVHARYAHHSRDAATAARTAVPYILKAENDLLKAEALIRSNGSRATAASLINVTRVGRGGLSALSGGESDATLLAAIDHERDVELANTNAFDLYYARTAPTSSPLGANVLGGRIQPGTVRHLPIPARELEVLGKAVYTYGGVSRADMAVVGFGAESGLTPVIPTANSINPSCPAR